LTGGNGNGSVLSELPTDRLERIEVLLAVIQKELDFQFRRIAALQAQVDRAMAAQAKNAR